MKYHADIFDTFKLKISAKKTTLFFVTRDNQTTTKLGESTIGKVSDLEVLDLGWNTGEELGKYVSRVQFANLYDPQLFFSHDVIFIDPNIVSQLWVEQLHPQEDGSYSTSQNQDRGFSRGLQNLLSTRQVELNSRLKTAGTVVFCRFRDNTNSLKILNGDKAQRVHKYSWLPDQVLKELFNEQNITNQKGTNLKLTDNQSPVSEYLEDNKEHVFYEAAFIDLPSGKKGIDFSPIAETPEETTAAIQIDIYGSKIFFLPELRGISREVQADPLNKLLTQLSADLSYLEPDWIKRSQYSLKSQKALDEKIRKAEKEITNYQEIKQSYESKKQQLMNYTRLLCARDNAQLKESLAKTLESLDYSVDFLNSDIDLYVCPQNENCYAINVGAAANDSIGLEPYHRLVKGINELKIFENDDPQGVLVVNGFAAESPDSRDKQITDDLKRACNLYGFTIVTTDDIFQTIKESMSESDFESANLDLLFEEN